MFWKKKNLRIKAAAILRDTGWAHKDIKKAVKVKPRKAEEVASKTEENSPA